MPLFLVSLLGFVTRPPGSYLAIAGACAVALWGYGQYEFGRGEAAMRAAQAKAVTRIVDRQSRITLKVSQTFDAVKIADAAATQKQLQEVKTHVSEKADADCTVPLGFVRVFNTAVHGPIPGAAAGADDTPSGAQLSDVAQVTVQNDGQYDQVADQLRALQNWVRQQQAARP
ncbi:MAG TPA: hypothetical protein VHC39_16305 [Rhizomicrobium sp.]|nr:hypothetical protein [Rhizomicrobium sp.]